MAVSTIVKEVVSSKAVSVVVKLCCAFKAICSIVVNHCISWQPLPLKK